MANKKGITKNTKSSVAQSVSVKKSTSNTDNTMYIITESFNWADEIDFDGFVILTKKDLLDLKNEVQSLIDSGDDEEIEISVGTNEDMESSYEEILDILDSAEEISNVGVDLFKKYLGLEESYVDYIKYAYGNTMLTHFIRRYL